MSNYSEFEGMRISVRKARRYWQKADAAKPWYPSGVLQTLCLGLLFVMGWKLTVPGVATGIGAQIDNVGVSYVRSSTGGWMISNQPADGSDREVPILAMADSNRCLMWAGRLRCPRVVNRHAGK